MSRVTLLEPLIFVAGAQAIAGNIWPYLEPLVEADAFQ